VHFQFRDNQKLPTSAGEPTNLNINLIIANDRYGRYILCILLYSPLLNYQCFLTAGSRMNWQSLSNRYLLLELSVGAWYKRLPLHRNA